MTINSTKGGLYKPKSKNISILYYSSIKPVISTEIYQSPEELGMTSAGAVSVSGIDINKENTDTASSNSSDNSNSLKDSVGNIFQYLEEENTSTPQDDSDSVSIGEVSFELLEVLNVDTLKVAYSYVLDTGNGIRYSSAPDSKPNINWFVIETVVKGKNILRLLSVEFSRVENYTISNDELAGIPVVYKIKEEPENYIYNSWQ